MLFEMSEENEKIRKKNKELEGLLDEEIKFGYKQQMKLVLLKLRACGKVGGKWIDLVSGKTNEKFTTECKDEIIAMRSDYDKMRSEYTTILIENCHCKQRFARTEQRLRMKEDQIYKLQQRLEDTQTRLRDCNPAQPLML